jgi:hypothetical protein
MGMELKTMLDVHFPITCPECGRESLSSLPAVVIHLALLKEERVTLRSRCHGIEWQASPGEAEQIRQYLGAAQLAATVSRPAWREEGCS